MLLLWPFVCEYPAPGGEDGQKMARTDGRWHGWTSGTMERAEDGADDQTVMMMELSDQDEDHGPKIHSECKVLRQRT